jgi:hypothetical protein
MCFRAADHIQKTVSFNFEIETDTHIDDDHLATEHAMEPIEDSLSHLRKQLEVVYRNLHFYRRRERVHRDLAESTCDRVVMTAVVKMIVLGMVGAIQIYILRGFFRSVPVGVDSKPI